MMFAPELENASLAERDHMVREWLMEPHRYFKAFSPVARGFQNRHRSARFRTMTLVGVADDFLKLRPRIVHLMERTTDVNSWEDVFCAIVRAVVVRCPDELRELDVGGYLSWMTKTDEAEDIVAAFGRGAVRLDFTSLEEAFAAVQWLVLMVGVKLNEVVVQVDPYEDNAAWRARSAEINAKREDEVRILREIDEARRQYKLRQEAGEEAEADEDGSQPSNPRPTGWL